MLSAIGGLYHQDSRPGDFLIEPLRSCNHRWEILSSSSAPLLQKAIYGFLLAVATVAAATLALVGICMKAFAESRPPLYPTGFLTAQHHSMNLSPSIHSSSIKSAGWLQLKTPVIKEEFKKLPWNLDAASDNIVTSAFFSDAKSPQACPLNRYANILPYDRNRYKSPNDSFFYINASWVHDKKFLVTQGPLPTTCGHFWRMVQESGSSTIVMLTNLSEGQKNKCAQYWPEDGKSIEYSTEGLSIKHLNSSVFAVQGKHSIVKRDFELTIVGQAPRMVTQYHYINWDDHDAADVGLVAGLIKEIDGKGLDTPVITHCSAGVGRTGVFVAGTVIRNQLIKGQNKDKLVFDTVSDIRQDRNQMVAQPAQYEMVYALAHHFYNELSKGKH